MSQAIRYTMSGLERRLTSESSVTAPTIGLVRPFSPYLEGLMIALLGYTGIPGSA